MTKLFGDLKNPELGELAAIVVAEVYIDLEEGENSYFDAAAKKILAGMIYYALAKYSEGRDS